jgi:hypothetical protein
LADFVAEWTDTQLPPPQIQAECWTLFFDGSVMKTGRARACFSCHLSGNTCGTLCASTSPRLTICLNTRPSSAPSKSPLS